MIGQKFNRLTVIAQAPRAGRNDRWDCSCDCGGATTAVGWSLRSGRSRSCGCLKAEELNENQGHENHKRYGTLEYRDWLRMKSVCNYPGNRAYKKYGGSGISVCERWSESFSAFLEDMGPAPSTSHKLARMDESGNFSPQNCHWVRGRLRKAPRLEKVNEAAEEMPTL